MWPEDYIQTWRANFDADVERIKECQRAIEQLRASSMLHSLSAEDCAFLWMCGIKAEENIIQ